MGEEEIKDEELAPTQTAGYKPGEKKTLEELAKLDAQDGMLFTPCLISSSFPALTLSPSSLNLLAESLKKWKESLGVGKAPVPAGGDARKVIVQALAMEVTGRSDVSIDLSTPGIQIFIHLNLSLVVSH